MMKTFALLSLAGPGAMIAGYVVLTGYLISRIQPVPIAFTHDSPNVLPLRLYREESDDQPQPVAV